MRYHKSTEICLVSGQSTEPLERVSTTERFGNTNLVDMKRKYGTFWMYFLSL